MNSLPHRARRAKKSTTDRTARPRRKAPPSSPRTRRHRPPPSTRRARTPQPKGPRKRAPRTPLSATVFAALVALVALVTSSRRSPDAKSGTPAHARLHATRAVLHVLQQLMRMLQLWSTPEGEQLLQQALAFGKGPDVAPPAPSPPVAPRAPYTRAASSHLRPLDIAHYRTVHELPQASIGELFAFAFPGDDDPILGMLASISADVPLMCSAIEDGEFSQDKLSMSLHRIGCRADVCAEFYRRVRNGMQDGNDNAPESGVRS
jgi:hypothetical protein